MRGALIVLCLRRFPVFGDLDMTYTTRGLESSRILRLICLGGEHGHTGRREAQTLLYNTGLSAGPSKDRPSYSAMLLNRRFSYNQLSRSPIATAWDLLQTPSSIHDRPGIVPSHALVDGFRDNLRYRLYRR